MPTGRVNADVLEPVLVKCQIDQQSSLQAEDLLRLDNQLCFALYAATRAMTRTYRERLDELNLTYPQYLVLLVLWETDGLTVSAIGQRLRLDSGTLTPLIKRMETTKLVRRKRDTDDGREVSIWLQPKGEALKTAALDARKHVACRLEMTEPEIMKLRADLMALISRLGFEPTAVAAE
jgi:MarR family transcriptional regulator, organic hydroperoxide resistance regulator